MPKVFVHGNPETSFVWSALVDELSSLGVDDIVLLSPPGFGAPVPVGFGGTRVEYRDWLIDQLEAIVVPVDLVGHDWGAGHTFAVAATRPDLLRSWVTDSAGLLHPDYAWHAAASAWQTAGDGEAAVGVLAALSPEVLVAAVGVPEALAREMAANIDATMGASILALYRSAIQPAMRQLGDQLANAERRPAMLIDPTADPYVSSDLASAVAERIGARTLTLEGLGHWWMWQDPAAVAAELVKFWSDT